MCTAPGEGVVWRDRDGRREGVVKMEEGSEETKLKERDR